MFVWVVVRVHVGHVPLGSTGSLAPAWMGSVLTGPSELRGGLEQPGLPKPASVRVHVRVCVRAPSSCYVTTSILGLISSTFSGS